MYVNENPLMDWISNQKQFLPSPVDFYERFQKEKGDLSFLLCDKYLTNWDPSVMVTWQK